MPQNLVASRCTKCSRTLIDPVSIAFGIGPECRKQIGFPEEAYNNTRLRELCTEANLNAFSRDYLNSLIAINEVRLMGFHELAAAMQEAVERMCKRDKKVLLIITMIMVDDTVTVYAPYKKTALSSWHSLMTWNKEKKCYEASVSSFNRRGFLEHLRAHYERYMVIGPKGVFWPGIHEKPVRHGQDGFYGVKSNGMPRFEEPR